MAWRCFCGATNDRRFCCQCGSPTRIYYRTDHSATELAIITASFIAIGITVFTVSACTQPDVKSETNVTATRKPNESNREPSASVSNPEEQVLPMDEADLVSTVSAFKSRYGAAPNEFQKSTVRRERAAAFARILPSLSVHDWIGYVSSAEGIARCRKNRRPDDPQVTPQEGYHPGAACGSCGDQPNSYVSDRKRPRTHDARHSQADRGCARIAYSRTRARCVITIR